ncbi:Lrp/AsnC family transcriptional regulator [Oceanospirillum linum]|uniref:AsnC family transcriptional regulator n=1 Tax=Oceanospirillum linum TaxID=966 RepID=A0A1T1HA96_OCELI|nr:Lrp/AsnC family transcriptional regulator [Oceanospirillum linum]OOV86779.1 AsnC family transcriptional regulator [Oceanospirillum linum]SEG22737.1 transcriptional regulator, AsnC family [Oleiphilus messinensis]SMP25430.1 transcriptional regulator, AsnC family [Oceanospirillum linum]
MHKTKQFDRIDRRILEVLQKNANISNLELAEQVGLSPSPCARRVKLLEDAGIISRQVTLLNQSALGLDMTIYVQICLASQLPERLEAFERKILNYDEVLECALITGSDADFMLKVVMPDMAYYEHFLLNELNRIEGVASIRTSFVLRQVKTCTELPLKHLK